MLVSFKMPFHCWSKTIASEISMSGDHLRLEGNKGRKICLTSGDMTSRLCPGIRNLTKKSARGGDLTRFGKFALGLPGGGNAWN